MKLYRGQPAYSWILLGVLLFAFPLSSEARNPYRKIFFEDAYPELVGTEVEDLISNDNHCGMCRILPEVGDEHASRFCLRKGLTHDNIDVLPFTSIREVQGQPGAFVVEDAFGVFGEQQRLRGNIGGLQRRQQILS